MTTPRDLAIVAFDVTSRTPVEQGDLSLALAGAELIDLLEARAVRLDDELVVPGNQPETADRLLGKAASCLARQMPYESVGDWLWRRGRGLSAAYLADLEAQGQLSRQRVRHWMRFRAGRLVLADSPARREAATRWAAKEPILVTLAAALGIRDRAVRLVTRRGRQRGGDRTGRGRERGAAAGVRTPAPRHRGSGLRQHLARGHLSGEDRVEADPSGPLS